MNATGIGKVFLFATLILSLVFAVLAVGIATNHIDWPGTATPTLPGVKTEGEYTRRKAEIDERVKAASAALYRWQVSMRGMAELEAERPKEQAWFANKMKIVEKGIDWQDKPAPILSLVFDNNRLQFKDGAPVMGPGNQPLRSRDALHKELNDTEADIQKQIQAAEDALRDADRLTIEINGDKKGDAKTLGLRDLLAEEETANRNGLDELEYLRPFRYNRQAEAELLYKRQRSLEARIEELKRLALASAKNRN